MNLFLRLPIQNLRKTKQSQISGHEIPQDLGLWRRSLQTLLKALDVSSATAWVSQDLLKALAILSDTTVRRSAVDQEDLEPYWK